jgi:hypothetical protein
MGKQSAQYKDENKICYYCNKRIGPQCNWSKCPNLVEEKQSILNKLITALVAIVLIIGVWFYGNNYINIP